jgi:hypothetical protein
MPIRVNTSGLKADFGAKRKRLLEIKAIMLAAENMAARDMRSDHKYVNHTDKLQDNTKTNIVRMSSAEIRIEIGMYTDYAEYVYKRGFTSFDKYRAPVAQTIRDEFERRWNSQ